LVIECLDFASALFVSAPEVQTSARLFDNAFLFGCLDVWLQQVNSKRNKINH